MTAQPYRTVIADDEPTGRNTIRTLLRGQPDFLVVAETATGEETLAALERERPDLLFLDVAMPRGDGFDTLERLALPERPITIFVTAHGQYSLRAFDVHAADYLLKPFSDERFHEAITHARRLLAGRVPNPPEPAPELLPRIERSSDTRAPGWIVVKTAASTRLLEWENIEWIEARGDYVRLHTAEQTYLIRESIGAIERRADSRRFVRVHRSTIVNLARVSEFRAVAPTEHVAIMTSGARCRISQRGRERLAEVLGQQL